MPKSIQIRIPATQFASQQNLSAEIANHLGIPSSRITGYHLLKKSLDARGKIVMLQLSLNVFVDEPFQAEERIDFNWQNVTNSIPVHIIGAGPAGLFAALELILLGLKPIIFERGKNVRDRRRDLAAINKEGKVNPESNYCFGEGGAGTYSDGKLYTRSNKRGDIQRGLALLVHFGASEDIQIEAHPHIGTNKLPQIISNIREHIISCGGEVHFNSKMTDIEIGNDQVKSITINSSERINVQHLILATGHSARDIFNLLHQKNIQIASKPFALGVRIEHPQEVIDQLQYKCLQSPTQLQHRPFYLPPASYALVSKGQQKSVYSFCMCPGGIIAPAATNPGEIVVNGWSPSKRNNPYANSGMVVAVNEQDFAQEGFKGTLAGMHFQSLIEQRSFEAAGSEGLKAPAINVEDFVNQKATGRLPICSYLPGIVASDLSNIFPKELLSSLKGALKEFDKKYKGYITKEAVLVATESRTSSPVTIPRHRDTFEHVQIKGLYPCAEGAGAAGGILSAAIDGMNIAKSIALKY